MTNYNKTCPICNKIFVVSYRVKRDNICCSPTCTNTKRRNSFKCKTDDLKRSIVDKIKSTSFERYGTDNPSKSDTVKDKIKSVHMEKYGVENVFQSEDIKRKIKWTNLNRYGVEHPMQLSETKDKLKSTFLLKYGVDCPNRLECVQDKRKKTSLARYRVEHPMRNNDVRLKCGVNKKLSFYNEVLTNPKRNNNCVPLFLSEDYSGPYQINRTPKQYTFKCIKCETKFEDNINDGLIPMCPFCHPTHRLSISEKEVVTFIKNEFPEMDIIENNRSIINHLELDIYIPEKKLAIEFWVSSSEALKFDFNTCKPCISSASPSPSRSIPSSSSSSYPSESSSSESS